MRRNFRDHAANERTFLAWIRTGIAVMAFGFLVEKFTIFLRYIGLSLKQAGGAGSFGTGVVGLVLVIVGAAMMAIAMVRFLLIEREIDREVVNGNASVWADGLLTALLVAIGLFLAFYLGHQMSL